MPHDRPTHRRVLLTAAVLAAASGLILSLAAGQDTVFSATDQPAPPGTPAAASAPSAPSAPAAKLVSVTVGVPPAGTGAQTKAENDEFAALILQALDQKVSLELTDAAIGEVIRQLSERTGIPIEMEPGTYDLLPYGSKTTLSEVKIKDRSLRESLQELLRPMSLTFEPRPRKVAIRALYPLFRIARRATWEELELLYKLYTTPYSPEVFASLSFQFQDARTSEFEANQQTLLQLAASVGEGPAAHVLEFACRQHGWSWYPSGKGIKVLSETRMVEQQLNRVVSLKYVQISLREALLDLARRAGVLLQMEPGVLASLPAQTTESFSLAIENATIRQALEIVAGETGLGYFIERDGIRFAANKLAPPPSSESTASAEAMLRAFKANPIIGQITIPKKDGSSFSFFLRENDLPAEVNEMRKAKIRNAVNDIRRSLAGEQPQD